MIKNSKIELVQLLEKQYSFYKYVFVLNFSGLKSNTNNTIRKHIRDTGSDIFVVKNTLNKISVSNTDHRILSDSMSGQNVSVLTNDPVSVAKILNTYTADEKSGIKVVAISDGKAIRSADYLKVLVSIPTMDVLRATLLSTLQSIPTRITSSLLYHQSSITRVVSNKFKI